MDTPIGIFVYPDHSDDEGDNIPVTLTRNGAAWGVNIHRFSPEGYESIAHHVLVHEFDRFALWGVTPDVDSDEVQSFLREATVKILTAEGDCKVEFDYGDTAVVREY